MASTSMAASKIKEAEVVGMIELPQEASTSLELMIFASTAVSVATNGGSRARSFMAVWLQADELYPVSSTKEEAGESVVNGQISPMGSEDTSIKANGYFVAHIPAPKLPKTASESANSKR